MRLEIPSGLLFSEEHEWIKIQENTAVIGISDHAQCSLGDVVYVELPPIGQEIKQGAPIGVVESVKAVSDIYAPMSGVVKALNQAVIDHPEFINQDPYGEGWLIMIELRDPSEQKKLLAKSAYEQLISREAK